MKTLDIQKLLEWKYQELEYQHYADMISKKTDNFVKPITTRGQTESACTDKKLYAAQKLLAQISSNFMAFPDFYLSIV